MEEEVVRKRERVAEASRKCRAKKKRELETLREMNKKLKEERAHFLAKIQQLESQVENGISSSDVKAIVENNALRLEIDMHKRFIDSFVKLTNVPSSLSGQRHLCREGAESAQAYLQGLVAESQTSWLKLEMPFEVPVEDFSLHYCFRENFFGSNEGGSVNRFNLRLDMAFPGIRAEKLASYYWDLYNSSEEQQKCFGLQAMELEQVDMPDKDTCLMYNRKTWKTPHHCPEDISYREKDQDVVFICNRQESIIPRSSLRPPNGLTKRGGSVSGDSCCTSAHTSQGGLDPFLGKTKVTTIAMTSTRSTHETLRTYAIEGQLGSPTPRNPVNEAGDEGVHHITSVISQGVLCWDDEERNVARLICVLSYPEEFRWLDYSFSDVVNEDGDIGQGFAQLLLGITMHLHRVMYQGGQPGQDSDEKKDSAAPSSM